MPSGDFCCVAPRGGTPSMISATELVQIAAPARSTGFVTFSGSLGSAKVFRAEPHEARYGRVKGRASGQLLGRIACPTATTTAAHSRHPRATSTLLAETAGQRRHRELVLRFLREISPQESISARHKTTKRGRHGQPARVGCDEDVVLRPRPRNRSQGCESPCCAASKSRPRAGRKPKSHFMQVIPCTSLVY